MVKESVNKTLISFNRYIFVLSLIGIIIAIYVLQSFVRQSPIVCINTGCELVRKNPASYLYGIPVPAFGLVGYSLMAILAFLRTTVNDKRLVKGIMAIAVFGVGFVSWFTYTELFVIKAICTWCAVSAINMIAIFFLTLQSVRKQKQI